MSCSTINSSIQTRLKRKRLGMQLIEMVATMAISTILLTGVASSVYISQRSLAKSAQQLRDRTRTENGLQRFQQDLAETVQVNSRTSTSVSLSVPDRNGDGTKDSIFYRWSSGVGPLERSMDNTNWTPLAANLSNMSLQWRSASPPAVEPSTPLDSTPGLIYRGKSHATALYFAAALSISPPPACLPGDLCIASIAVNGNVNLSTPSGWTKIYENSSGSVTLGVFYTKNMTTSVTFVWSDLTSAVGSVVHFSGNNTTDPFVNSAENKGNGTITAPAISGSYSRHHMVRILAGYGRSTSVDGPRVPNHSTVLLRQAQSALFSSNFVTLAIAHGPVPTTGVSTTTFNYSPSPSSACIVTALFKP